MKLGAFTSFKIMILGVLLLLSEAASGQEYEVKVKSIGVADGLTGRNIQAFFMDRKGIMWLGAETGLNQFDAHRITSYTVESAHLQSNFVNQIAEDGRDRLWLLGIDPNASNEKILQVFDPQTGSAALLSSTLDGANIPFDVAKVSYIGSNHLSRALWIIVDHKTIYSYSALDNNKGQFGEVHTSNDPVLFSAACPKGLWVRTKKHIMLFDTQGQVVQKFKNPENQHIGLFHADDSSNIFYDISVSSEEVKGQPRPALYVNEQEITSQHNDYWFESRMIGFDPYHQMIWFNDYRFDEQVKDLSLESVHSFDHPGELNSFPRYAEFDRKGNGWANYEGRVNIFQLEERKFTNYLTEEQVFSLDLYGARGLFVDEDNFLYTNGLGASYKINLADGEKKFITPPIPFYVDSGWDKERLKRLSLTPDGNGNLWYTDEGARLFRYNLQNGTFKDYTYGRQDYEKNSADPDPVRMEIHWSSFFDSRGKLWLGRNEGLVFLDTDSTLTSYDQYDAYPELKHAAIYDFYEDQSGIWMGTTTGLYLMTLEGGILKRFHTRDQNHYIPFNVIAHIHPEGNGIFWLSTKGGGIIKLNTSNGNFEQWTAKEGLSSNHVYAMYGDQYGYFWASSKKGIMQIKKHDFSINTYLQGDGLIHEEFNTTSHFQTSDGRIFFGSIDGVTSFHPKDFLDDSKSILDLQVVKVEKQSRNTGEFLNRTNEYFETSEVKLFPDEVGFSVDFTIADYLDAEYSRFSYKIDGLDQQWNYIDQPQIRINALPYGHYELLLRGQGTQGEWTRQISIPIDVIKPFYSQWWFFLFILALVSLTVFLVIKFQKSKLIERQQYLEAEVANRTKIITQQADELRQLDQLKSKFFANLSHELRTPISLILGPLSNSIKRHDLDRELLEELQMAQRNSVNISELVEELLDLSKLDANKVSVNKSPTLLYDFLKEIFESFNVQAKFQKIDFEFHFDGVTPSIYVLLDQAKVRKIVNNLLSNAFKFTQTPGQITVSTSVEEGLLTINVVDTGSGIASEDVPHVFDRFYQAKHGEKLDLGGNGIGLSLSQELAHLMGGKITVSSALGKGSGFTLNLPCPVTSDRPVGNTALAKFPPINNEKVEAPLIDKNFSILVVEDQMDMQKYLISCLSEQYQVMAASNGQEALDLLKKEALPSLIITDMMMPVMDGMALVTHLKKQGDYQGTPIMMLTARSEDSDKVMAFRLGIDDYMVKPFSTDELKIRAARLIQNARAREIANQLASLEDIELTPSNHKTEEWLKEIRSYTEEHISDVDFNVGAIAEQMGMSSRQFQRRLKGATGMTPVKFLREVRLQMARNYLEKRAFDKVSEVSTSVGFTSTAYFSTLFQERFGKKPGDYLVAAKPN